MLIFFLICRGEREQTESEEDDDKRENLRFEEEEKRIAEEVERQVCYWLNLSNLITYPVTFFATSYIDYVYHSEIILLLALFICFVCLKFYYFWGYTCVILYVY